MEALVELAETGGVRPIFPTIATRPVRRKNTAMLLRNRRNLIMPFTRQNDNDQRMVKTPWIGLPRDRLELRPTAAPSIPVAPDAATSCPCVRAARAVASTSAADHRSIAPLSVRFLSSSC